jgi:cell wall-associated NlpC family hydrolase
MNQVVTTEVLLLKKISSLIISSVICFTFTVPAMADITNKETVAAISSGMIIPQSCAADIKKTISSAQTPAANSTPTASRKSSGDVRNVIQEARSLLGKGYKYGTSGPDTFDCSGLVMYVFNKASIKLPHNAAEQASCGVHVDKSDLEPGDVVFFSYYGGKSINHSGVYIGDNKFIHSSTNKGVITTSLSSDYYSSNYKGARRVIR